MRAFAAPLLLLCEGCFSATGLGRARTLGAGHVEAGGAVELSSSSGRVSGQTSLPWAHVGAVARVGVHDRVDLGARVSFAAIDGADSLAVWIDPKIQVTRSAHESRGWDVALVPSVGWQQVRLGDAPWHVPQVALSALFGLNLGRHQLVLSGRAGYQALLGTSMQTQHIGWVGASIGGAFRVGRWDLAPELVLAWAPGVRFNGESAADNAVGAGLGQVGFSFAHRW
jgi:hypothetical protein